MWHSQLSLFSDFFYAFLFKTHVSCDGQESPEVENSELSETAWGSLGLFFVFMPGRSIALFLSCALSSIFYLGPVACIYFLIVYSQEEAPTNLPSVLLHIQKREDKQEVGIPREISKKVFERKTFFLISVLWMLPFSYPLGSIQIQYTGCPKNLI